MRALVFCAVVAALAAGVSATTVVANYQGDFTATTPSAGWSYLWNPLNKTLGNSANYSPLAFNSTNNEYETLSTGSLPHAGVGGYLSASSTGVTLGQTAAQASDGLSHYVILAYTFNSAQIAADGSSLLFHSYNFNVPNDPTLGSLDVEIFKNNTLLAPFQFPAGTTFSDAQYGPDYAFGPVSAGDTLYIALGGTSTYSGQQIGVAYTLALTTPEPTSLGMLALAPLLLRRRRR
jgi:hypothetical protein